MNTDNEFDTTWQEGETPPAGTPEADALALTRGQVQAEESGVFASTFAESQKPDQLEAAK